MTSTRFRRLLKILAGALADTDEVFPLEGRLERFLHFWTLVVRQFIRHRCLVRASALSYSTLLAMIPLLVVALSVTSSLLNPGQEAKLTRFVERTVSSVAPPASIPTNVLAAGEAGTNAAFSGFAAPGDTNVVAAGANAPAPESPETLNTRKEVAREIHELVQKASSGALGAFGLILLIITAVSLLRGIEETLNDIWGVTRSRHWFRQFVLYWFVITIGPLLLSAALGITGTLHMQRMRGFLETSPFLAPLVQHGLPICLFSLLLAFFYKLTPNTQVNFKAACIGGVCAGTAWHVYNQLGFLLAARAMSASKFYGGVFLIVLLMGGLYILWLIVLFGAQIAYAFQNRLAYLQDRLAENVNQRGREFVALRIMTCIGRRFQNGQPPATVPEIAADLGVPSRLTQTVLRTLTGMQLVTEVSGEEAAFAPARPLESISAYDILIAMRTGTGQDLPVSELPELAEIYGEFARIEQAERNAAAGISLFALANRAPRAELPPSPPAEPEKPLPHAAPVAARPPQEPEKVEPPAVAPEPASAPIPEKAPRRREAAQPEENTDFPL